MWQGGTRPGKPNAYLAIGRSVVGPECEWVVVVKRLFQAGQTTHLPTGPVGHSDAVVQAALASQPHGAGGRVVGGDHVRHVEAQDLEELGRERPRGRRGEERGGEGRRGEPRREGRREVESMEVSGIQRVQPRRVPVRTNNSQRGEEGKRGHRRREGGETEVRQGRGRQPP